MFECMVENDTSTVAALLHLDCVVMLIDQAGRQPMGQKPLQASFLTFLSSCSSTTLNVVSFMSCTRLYTNLLVYEHPWSQK